MAPPPEPWTGHRRPGRRAFPKRTARHILRRAGHTCQLELPGCTGTATHADHIIGWANATALGWDPAAIDHPDNGQALCPHCHTLKTQAEAQQGKQRAAARRPSAKRAARPHPGLKPPS